MIYNQKNFKNQKDFFNFLSENKETIITQKKSAIKYADCIVCSYQKNDTKKTHQTEDENGNGNKIIKVSAVINTTNYLDSHDDVHIDGIWTKTLTENPKIFHLQEHKNEFEKIISSHDDLTVFAKKMKWSELGVDYVGETEALIFDSNVRENRNSFMFSQYKNNWVDNHSVGMQYVNLFLAINDKELIKEYEIWEKYYELIANKEVAEKKGFFFAVTEAKLIEGSAVLRGSNDMTPTIAITEVNNEPENSTQKNILNFYYKQLKN
jgi:hypothetical protein